MLVSIFASTVWYFSLNYSIFLWLFRQVFRVTEVDSISKTAVWPIFILINIVTALKGIHF